MAVAALVSGDDPSQVIAGPGAATARFAIAEPLSGLQLQEVVEKPAALPLAGSPYLEVYGRVAGDGEVESVVAVLTAASPEVVERILAGSGAAIDEPRPGWSTPTSARA